MDTNFIIEIIYKSIFPDIKTYYEFNCQQLDIFENWYNTFDIGFYNQLEISRDVLTYKLVETKEDIELATLFLNTFSRPFDILEEIDELNELFINDIYSENADNSYSEKSDNSCYEETETINTIIKAHIDGDTKKVKHLLTNINIEDDIINDLKIKYIN
jgi:hypothetical protein